jgi:hypothetical protein
LGFQAETEKRRLSATKVKEPVTHIEKPLEENLNRLQIIGEEACSVDEAIAMLRYRLTSTSSAILKLRLHGYVFIHLFCFGFTILGHDS